LHIIIQSELTTAAISPDEFQAAALAWLTAISVVAGAVLAAIITIVPRIAALKQAMKDNSQRLDDHSRRITENSSRVTQVALEVSPNKESKLK
jgi:hypothetical protein